MSEAIVSDGMNVVQERTSANTPTVAYTRGPDLSSTLQGAGGIGGMLARSHGYSGSSWSTHNFYHADGVGSPREITSPVVAQMKSGNLRAYGQSPPPAVPHGEIITYLVNASQALAAKYKYDPYGRTISSSGTLATANRYRFSSKEIHPNSGLYYFGYRFYNPSLQRWMNRDPIGELGGVNLFRFNWNDSIGFFDANGRCPATSPGPGNIFTGLTPPQQVEACQKAAPVTVGLGLLALAPFAPELAALPLSALPGAATLGEALQLPFVVVGMGGIAGAEAGLVFYGTHPWATPATVTGAGMVYEEMSGHNVVGPPDAYDPLHALLWLLDDGADIYFDCE